MHIHSGLETAQQIAFAYDAKKLAVQINDWGRTDPALQQQPSDVPVCSLPAALWLQLWSLCLWLALNFGPLVIGGYTPVCFPF